MLADTVWIMSRLSAKCLNCIGHIILNFTLSVG